MRNKIDLGVYELSYSMNFKSQFQELILFAAASWNLAVNLLSSISNKEALTNKQKMSIFLVENH
jgi:hypothetical protein